MKGREKAEYCYIIIIHEVVASIILWWSNGDILRASELNDSKLCCSVLFCYLGNYTKYALFKSLSRSLVLLFMLLSPIPKMIELFEGEAEHKTKLHVGEWFKFCYL